LNFFSLFKRNLIYKFKKKINIDNDNVNANSLDSLFHYFGSDKSNIFKKTNDKGHGYSIYYKKKLDNLKEKKINILEIGSYSGASAAAFVKYFPNSNIYCFDINLTNFKYRSKRIHTFGIDINNEKKVIKTLNYICKNNNVSKFDIIIDDGSHNLSDILFGVKLLFSRVKEQGFYIIEDFKYPNYHNYNKNINHILVDELLENLINKRFFKSEIFTRDNQEYLINSIKKIEVFKGNLNDSDISFISKN
jgi:predicted O-methyltransferase YrrM